MRSISFFLLFGSVCFSTLAQSFDCEEELFSKKDKKSRLFGYVNAIGEFRIPPRFLKAKPFVGRNAIVQDGKMFGIVNCEGVLVLPADYEDIASFSNGKGWVKRSGLWGLANAKGQLLIQPLYEDIKEVNTFNGSVTWVKKGGLWGLMNKENGRFIVQNQYEDVSSISDSAGIGRNSGTQDLVYYGDGRVIISKMKQVTRLSANLFAYQSSDGFFGAFNPLAYIMIRPEWDKIEINGPLIQVKMGGLFGLRSFKGNEILETKYAEIQKFIEGYAGIRLGNNWQIVSTTGKISSPPGEFTNVAISAGGRAILEMNGQAGLWDLRHNKFIIPIKNQTLRFSASQKWVELVEEGKAKIFLTDKSEYLPTTFDSLSIKDSDVLLRAYRSGNVCLTSFPFFNENIFYQNASSLALTDWFQVEKEKMLGIINNENKLVIPIEFQSIILKRLQKDFLFVVKKDLKAGLIDLKGKILLPATFDELVPCVQNLSIFAKNHKWGLMTNTANILQEPKFDSIVIKKLSDEFGDFPVVAYKNGKSQLLNAKGELLTDPEKVKWNYLGENIWAMLQNEENRLYDSQGKPRGNLKFQSILPFSDGNAAVKSEGKWGFVNLFGRLVIPSQYEEVLPYQAGIAFAKQNGKWGILKKNGAWLVKPIGLGVSLDENGKRRLVMP